MIDVTPKLLWKLLADDRVPVIDLGERSQKILLTDLVDFLWSRRRIPGGTEIVPGTSQETKEEVLRALRD